MAQESGRLGVISGSVLDAEYGGPIANARVLLVGSDAIASADMNGHFYIQDVAPGDHEIHVYAEYYKSTNVQDLKVAPGETARVDVPLYSDDSNIIELEAFTVKAEALASSDLGLLSKRQKAPQVSDAIGAESFSRLGLSDAADALAKVTGASMVDGKYLVMRGLSDRYNNTTLNGATLPSSDPDRKAVQLDQFPSGLIDVIETTKTFSPDMSGEFTGGTVNIETKAFPDRLFFQTSYGIGYSDSAQNGNFLTYDGGGSDWLGRDDGTRELPEIAKTPENLTAAVTPETRDAVINAFSKTMNPSRGNAPLSQSASLAFGDSIQLSGESRLGYVGSLTYRRDVSHVEDYQEKRYDTFYRRSTDEWVLQTKQDFVGDASTDAVNIGALLNLSYQINGDHEIGLKNFYSQSGTDVAVFHEGINIDSEDIFLRESRLHYTERNITSSKLYGAHRFVELGGAKIEWDYSRSSTQQDEPDFRLFFDRVRLENYPDPEPQHWGFPVGITNQRLFRELEEEGDEYGVDVTVPFTVGERRLTVKAGARKIEADRRYDELALGFSRDPRGGSVPYRGDRDNFLTDETAGFDSNGVLRRVMIDVSAFVPSYEGMRKIDALYFMLDAEVTDRLRVVAGARQEDTFIEVTTFDRFGDPALDGVGSIEEESLLPAVNVTWALTDRQNLRLAYSETVARPNFRELSPVGGYSAIATRLIIGNPELEMTSIKNYDARWEFFGSDGNLLAASLFYKELKNPIESTVSFSNDHTWQNVPTGEVLGVELEARKRLLALSGENRAVHVGGNFSLVDSEVQRTEDELIRKQVLDPDISPTRELQDQARLVGNVDLSAEWYDLGSAATLAYNYTGERLYQVSVAQLPDVYQRPGDTLDFIFSQRIGENWKAKLKVGNLLDSKDESFHDFFGEEQVYALSSSGRSYSLSFTYEFH